MTAIPRVATPPAQPRDGAAPAPARLVEVDARGEAERVTAIAKAVMAARAGDPELTARGLLTIIEVLVADSAEARTTLAIEAVRMAMQLDEHVANVIWH